MQLEANAGECFRTDFGCIFRVAGLSRSGWIPHCTYQNRLKSVVKQGSKVLLNMSNPSTPMERREQHVRKDRRSKFRSSIPHFVCPMPLRNRLPEPTPGPKLAALPNDLQSFVEFNFKSPKQIINLETEYKVGAGARPCVYVGVCV